MQHVDIAMVRFQSLYKDSLAYETTEIFNVRGYGITSAHVAYGWYLISGQVPNARGMILLNRQLSTVFALLTICLVYLIGRDFGLAREAAGCGALLLAFCDLNCSYSHYGIPSMGYVFAVFLSVYGALKMYRGRPSGILWLALGSAMAFAFKFDFLPTILGGCFLLYALFIQPNTVKETIAGAKPVSNSNITDSRALIAIPALFRKGVFSRLLYLLGAVLLLVLFFGLVTGFSWPITTIKNAWQVLREVNQDVIAEDQHWFHNLLVYPAAIIAGIGLPACLLAIFGLRSVDKKHWRGHPVLLLLLGLMAAECLVRWSIDTPFVRRANVFMPAICLAAGYGLQKLRQERRHWGKYILVYTCLLALVGQSNHWHDTRESARDWANTQLPPTAKVAATPYVDLPGLRKTVRYQAGYDWDYAILHESFYSRYTLSMTTPFGYPDCCAGVYHCHGVEECTEIQHLVRNNGTQTEIIARFQTRNYLPEKWLYHQFFGNYESFLGDVIIARRR